MEATAHVHDYSAKLRCQPFWVLGCGPAGPSLTHPGSDCWSGFLLSGLLGSEKNVRWQWGESLLWG